MRNRAIGLVALMMVASLAGCASSSSVAETTTQTEAVTTAPSTEAVTTPAETTEEVTTVADETTEEATTAGESDKTDGATLGETLREAFKTEVENTTDPQALAEKLSNADLCGYDCGTMEVEEGLLNGFSGEIKGFSKGVQFGPWIGSVPFIGYVFETEDAEALVECLKSNADPRWNICTEAAETVVEISGNTVFFTMCPGPDEF